MSLNAKNYKEFYFGALISKSWIYKGKAMNKDELESTDNKINAIAYITRTRENNGCEMLANNVWIDASYIEKWNAITIWDTTATCFYQDKQFITGDHMVIIRADWLNKYTWLYIVTLLNIESYKYSYGRAFVIDKIKNTILKLPVNDLWNPDRTYMENYIKSLHSKPITTKNKPWKNMFHTDEWKEFRIGDIFETKKAYAYNKETFEESITGKLPCITRTSMNNGCDYKWEITEDLIIEQWNALTIGWEWILCFYQPEIFVCWTNITILRNKFLNKYVGMFLCSIINIYSKWRFSYWRAFNRWQIIKSIIKLPVNSEWNPDREYMENYIKNLPYGDRI